MKKNFKYLLGTLILCAGFTGCSNSNEENDQSVVTSGPKDVAIRVLRSSTYAVEGTAVGVTPDFNDAVVYFIGGGNVLMSGTMTAAEIAVPTGKVFSNVPGGATKVFIVGNSSATAPSIGSPTLPTTIPTTEATLMASYLDQTRQTNARTAVNLMGTGNIVKTNPTAFTANVAIAPAVSRIEIAQISANDNAAIKLTGFTLAGIFINNTYLQLGMDYTTKPTGAGAANLTVNYGTGDAGSFTGGATSAFYAKAPRLCDVGMTANVTSSPAPGTPGTPATPGTDRFWSYSVLPPTATAGGTTLNGATAASSAVPHIVLHITNAAAPGYTFPADAFVTVTKFRDKGTNNLITAFAPGKVYKLTDAIAIGGEHLSDNPENPTSADITVTVTVNPWEDANVGPEL